MRGTSAATALMVKNLGGSTLRRLTGGGVLLGSVLLGANQLKDKKKNRWDVMTEYPKSKIDDVLLSRKITSAADTSGLGLRLYQFQTCPYCCKVRAFLDYFGFSYEVVEVNALTKAQIKFCPHHQKVPILTSSASSEPLVESSMIISTLATYLMGPKKLDLAEILSYYPAHVSADPKDAKKTVLSYPNKYFVMFGDTLSQDQIQAAREEREWREWVDEHFIHLISPNVYRTLPEALETFRYFDKAGDWERVFSPMQRYAIIYIGAAAMRIISKRIKKRHNILDERQAMKQAFEEFLHAKGGRPFLGGGSPSLADLSLYGAINSFVGCSAFSEMRQATNIGQWYDAMQAQVDEHKGAQLLAEKCSDSD